MTLQEAVDRYGIALDCSRYKYRDPNGREYDLVQDYAIVLQLFNPIEVECECGDEALWYGDVVTLDVLKKDFENKCFLRFARLRPGYMKPLI